MKIGLKKFIVAVLVVVLVFPTGLFVAPKKVEAQTGVLGCLFNALGLLGSLNSMVGGIMSVPVNDKAVGSNTNKTASEVQKANLVTCVLNGLVWTLVNTMIQNFTASVVDWINSGFQGSPSFVTDPEGFFMNVGDEVIGQWIEELGPVGQVLCSPFDLNIRIALGLNFKGGKYPKTIHCRLSDVQKNVYNAFVKGKSWGKDGWANWISISQPNNNAYGVYLNSSTNAGYKENKLVGLKSMELQWGKGFMSFRECTASRADGSCAKYENIGTPGSVIETQLNNTLGSSQRRLEIADSINEIMDALMNQAIGQIFKGGGGLLGMSSGSSYNGGRSYVNSLVTTYETELASTNIRPPYGINCANTYRIVEASNITNFPSPTTWPTTGKPKYVARKLIDGYWKRQTANPNIIEYVNGKRTCLLLSTAGPGYVKECLTEMPAYDAGSDVITSENTTISEFQTQIQKGCANMGIQNNVSLATNSWLAEQGGGIEAPGGGNATQVDENILIKDTTTVSQNGVFSFNKGSSFAYATKAIDGNKSTRSYWNMTSDINFILGGYTATSYPYNLGNASEPPWWQASFVTSNIKEVRIYLFDHDANPYPLWSGYKLSLALYKGTTMKEAKFVISSRKPFVSVLSGSDSIFSVDAVDPANDIPAIIVKLNNSFLADKLRITGSQPNSTYGNLLPLNEVEAWGVEDKSGAGGTVSSSNVQITSRDVPNHDVYPDYSIENPITLSSTENIPTLDLDVSLERINGTNVTPIPLGEVFAIVNSQSPVLERSLVIGQTNPEPIIISSTPNSYNSSLSAVQALSYYLKLKLKLKPIILDTADPYYSTYKMTVSIKEKGSGIEVGKQTYSFTVKPSWQ